MIRVRINATSERPPLQYRVNGGPWQDSPVFEVEEADFPLLFEVLDADDCITTYTMGEPPAPPPCTLVFDAYETRLSVCDASIDSTNVVDDGAGTATVTITATTTTPPLQYRVNGGAWQDSNVFAIGGVAPGTYAFDILDPWDCADTISLDLFPVPLAPQNLVGNIDLEQVTLKWGAPASGAPTSYNVYVNGVFHANILGNLLEYTVTGLTNGVEYSFYIAGVNFYGEGAQSATILSTPGNPEPVYEVFTASGTWDWVAAGSPATVDVWIIAGAGGGGMAFSSNPRLAGGGGSGGRRFLENYAVAGNIAVVVGTGGNGSTDIGIVGGSGGNSSFDGQTATGGGGGGSTSAINGVGGGSGGGGAYHATLGEGSGGSGVVGQGSNGANGSSAPYGGGGGGIISPGSLQNGGAGEEINSVIYGIGGDGGTGSVNQAGVSALPNTGNGGGGGAAGGVGGNGGSGVVIVRYWT